MKNFLTRIRRNRWFWIPMIHVVLVFFLAATIGWIHVLNYFDSLKPPQFTIWSTEERDDFGFSYTDPHNLYLTNMYSLNGSPLIACYFELAAKNFPTRDEKLYAMAVVDAVRAKRVFYAEWTNTSFQESQYSTKYKSDGLIIFNAFSKNGRPFFHAVKEHYHRLPLAPLAIPNWMPFIHLGYTRHFLLDTQGNAQSLSIDSFSPLPRGYATISSLPVPKTRESVNTPQSIDLIEYQADGLQLREIGYAANLKGVWTSYTQRISEHGYIIANFVDKDFFLVQTQPPLARQFNFTDLLPMTSAPNSIIQDIPYQLLTQPTDPFPLIVLTSSGFPVFHIKLDRLEKGEVRDIFTLAGENYAFAPKTAIHENRALLFDGFIEGQVQNGYALWISKREDRPSSAMWFPPPQIAYTFLTQARFYQPLDSERLLVDINSEIWTIRWDGTDLKKVFPRVKVNP